MAQQNQPNTYTQGHSNYTTANHERRTAEKDAAFLLPHIKETDHILDIGCGPGTITTGFTKYASKGAIVGVDISTDVLEKAKTLAANAGIPTAGPGSVVFEEGNVLTKLPCPDETFDVVYLSQVFGHLIPAPDVPRQALKEIRRVLKPNGILATRDGADSHFHPQSLDLDRLWTQNLRRCLHKGEPLQDYIGPSMPALLRSAGFDVDGGKVKLNANASAFFDQETRKWLAWRATGQLQKGDPFHQSWLDTGITQDEIQETLDAVEKWANTEDASHISLQCEVLAWK